jgi:tetratricopeptide (TPR) repeat protein
MFTEIFDDAVAEILRHEDPDRFFDWFDRRLARSGVLRRSDGGGAEDVKALSRPLGRALWNAMPLPGNEFRPRPFPAPGRNDACPCGSGRKFKRCCAYGPQPPALDGETLWPMVLSHLPAKSRHHAIGTGRVPMAVLAGLAQEIAEAGKPKKAAELLEPAFAGKIHGHGEDHDVALNLLCNLYDELGHTSKKTALLARVVKETRRSPLRSGALQRLATIKMDAGDPAGAWADFQAAQRDDPKSPNVGLLEVQLLMAQGRLDLARERAGFWLRRLRSLGWPDEEGGPVALMEALARDPAQTMADVGLEMAGDAGRPLIEWLQRVSGRPLPAYRLSHEPPDQPVGAEEDAEAALVRRMRGMGIPSAQIAPVLADFRSRIAELEAETDDLDELDESDFDELEADGFDEPDESEYESTGTLFLVAPPAVAALEAEWHAVFLQDKPFSVHPTSFSDDDVWDPDEEEDWMEFLEAHPEAFDSLDILDDLATAVEDHPSMNTPGVAEKLLLPLLRRAHAITDAGLSASENPQLHWGWTENRPALRSLVRLVYLDRDLGNHDAAAALAASMLSLNPHDNHGLRTLAINAFLREGDDERAVELARCYPGDSHPDVAYGEVLALFRLARHEEAQGALDEALQALPKVPRFLTSEKVRKPKMDRFGVTVGGNDQAWLYREEMRDVWDATPGALEWLRKASNGK